MMKYLYLFTGLLMFAACESDPDCPGFKEEPLLLISTSVSYDSIYSIKYDGTPHYAVDSSSGCAFFDDVIPMNISKDHFTIYLKKGSDLDTVTLAYKLNGTYTRGACGYRFALDSMKVQSASTTVNSVELFQCDGESFYKITMP